MCVGGRGERATVTGVVLKVEGDRALFFMPAPESRGRIDLGATSGQDVWLPIDCVSFLSYEANMATVEEIEKRRAERRAQHDKGRVEQEAADLGAIDALEQESGEPLNTMTTNGFKPGVSVKIAFRAPTGAEYKRYCDMVGKAQQKGDAVARRAAQEMLAASCWVYPAADSDMRPKMLDAFPGVLISLAIEAAKVAELRSEDEGKG